MFALITGANGFLGAQLAKKLVADGHKLRALVRPTSNLQLLEGVTFEKAMGDVTDAESVKQATEGVEVVYHLAGIRRTPHLSDFARINVEGTRNVLDAAAKQPKPPRVVLAGSLSAMGPSENASPLNESAPFRPVEAYGQSKVDAEKLCREYASKVPFAIGRAPRVLGPGDRENLAFVKLVKRGLLMEIEGGPRPLSMVDVDDVVEGFALLGTHPAAAGETFFLTAPETVTIERIQELAATVLGLPIKRRIKVAPWGLRALARVADVASQVTGKHLPLNKKLAEQLLAPAWTCSPEKARKTLGFQTRHSLADSVSRSVKWYVARGWV
jgi:nucleoside-diphosphate-sugar epimerase